MSIEYKVTGNGQIKLLILHGWLSDKGVFDLITPFFDESQFTIARMDFRGYGLSRHLKGAYSIDEIAQDALDLGDTLKWDSFHVLGHSMGGMVLQKMALLAPSRVLSGIAVTPVPASGFEIDVDTRAFFQSAADDDDALTEIFNILTGKRHSKNYLNQLTQSTRKSTTREAFLGYLSAWTQTNFSDQVETIKCPIHVIAGAHDGAFGPESMKETYLSQLKNVKMEIIEGAGHYPMLEAPAEFFTVIEKKLHSTANFVDFT